MKKSIAISVSMLAIVLMLGLNVLAQRTTGDMELPAVSRLEETDLPF